MQTENVLPASTEEPYMASGSFAISFRLHVSEFNQYNTEQAVTASLILY